MCLVLEFWRWLVYDPFGCRENVGKEKEFNLIF